MPISPSPLVFAFSAVMAAAAAIDDTEIIRTTEHRRLAALVAGDLTTARQMHAADFQLISPFGDALSREDYLGGLAAGGFDYVLWEPGPIAVRRHGDSAIVRYQARAVVTVRGKPGPEHRYWHTDYYERRDGRWQVVWSQATQIEDEAPPPP
ncbi:MAG: nuclear transport factor 2 family protein [Dehalococcoidia bacterium]|nr:nuclear transport factor 2 family protein [Dehalococcoidia bacterium]